MTQPTDDFLPQSGHGLHAQESGYDGYSSNMEHKFSDDYSESSFPVADKGSFVMPIPKGELDDCEHPKKCGKIWSPPSKFDDPAAAPKAESHHVTLEKASLKTPTVAVAHENNFPPRTTKIALPENNQEEEGAKVPQTRTTAISKEGPDNEIGGGDGSIIDTNMDRGTPEKTKGGERMSSEHRKKRTAAKNYEMYLRCLVFMSCFVCVSWGAPAGAPLAADQNFKCFVCMNKDRCPNLTHVFIHDRVVYQREPNSKIPWCCGFTPTNSSMTTVCRNQSHIIIISPEGVRKVDAEDHEQLTLSSDCTYVDTIACRRARYGLIASVVLFLIAVPVLVIYSCCHKKGEAERTA